MEKQYKYLLFDLDDTLVDDYENRTYAFSKVLESREEEVTQEKIDKFINIDKQFWSDRASGKIKDPYTFKSKEEQTIWVRAQRFLIYFKDITLKEAVKINEIYEEAVKEKVIPIKDAVNILKFLYDKQYKMYIITNGPNRAVKSKLEKSNLINYITCYFSADEIGFMKPKKEFFEGFMKKVNLEDKEKMLIIGDELDKDIKGGITNKIDTCWINRNKIENMSDIKPNYEIKDLLELKEIL